MNNQKMLPAIRLATAVVTTVDEEYQNQYDLFKLLGCPIGCLFSHKVILLDGRLVLVKRSDHEVKDAKEPNYASRSVNLSQRYLGKAILSTQTRGKFGDEDRLPWMNEDAMSITTAEVCDW